jgi:hypothetical protein
LQVNDQIKTNSVPKEDWKTHHSKLWFDIREKRDEEMAERVDCGEKITM